MIVFRYDRTFEGLLTVVFDAYFRKSFPERLIGPGEPVPMFAREVLDSTTDPVRAERVWKGLRKKLPRRLRNMLLHVWLSESVGADELLLRYMRKIFDSPERKSADFTDADVLAVHDIARTVSREATMALKRKPTRPLPGAMSCLAAGRLSLFRPVPGGCALASMARIFHT